MEKVLLCYKKEKFAALNFCGSDESVKIVHNKKWTNTMELLENKAKETRQVQTYTSITLKKKKRKVGTTKKYS